MEKKKTERRKKLTNFGELTYLDSDNGIGSMRSLKEAILSIDYLVCVARLGTCSMSAPIPSLSARVPRITQHSTLDLKIQRAYIFPHFSFRPYISYI